MFRSSTASSSNVADKMQKTKDRAVSPVGRRQTTARWPDSSPFIALSDGQPTLSPTHDTADSKRVKSKDLGRLLTVCSASGHGSVSKDPVNKQNVESQLFDYIVQHIREPEDLKRLRAITIERFPKAAKMAVSPEQGAFLRWLVELMGATRAIEVGVFTGYSSVCIADGIRAASGHSGTETCTLIALDRDSRAMETAREFWDDCGLSDLIDGRCAPALDSLEDIVAQNGPNSFDFAFIDADKRAYMKYYEILLEVRD